MNTASASQLEPGRSYVGPRDALELQLTQIWEDLLNRRPIGVDQDFFLLGGDSLLAMSLLARIVQDTGCSLPPAGIFQAPTIEKLARALRAEAHPGVWSPLVPIQPQGSRPPFFCVHPGGGNVLCYLQLSQHLGPEQPFFGLQCPGVDGVREPLTSAADMAREYVAAIQLAFPHGPYALGGWSVGGVLAYEMAQQLRQAGQRVSLLALLDSGVLYAWALLSALYPKGETGLFEMLRLPSAQQLAEFRRRCAPARLIPEHADDLLAGRILRLFAANIRAVIQYQARPYPGPVTLFRAREALVKERSNPYREWTRLCEQVVLHEVPGNHLTMIHEPHVSGLAECLRQCLAAAEQ